MSKVLVSFPGRAGDLLWSLPVVRAISESLGHPVDLQIAGEFASMVDLLTRQPYLAGVIPDPRWSMTDGWEAPTLPARYDRMLHLGYRRWPELPLPFEVARNAALDGTAVREPDLARPWITVAPAVGPQPDYRMVQGWTDCHFELKFGLIHLLAENWTAPRFDGYVLAAPGSRWVTEASMEPVSWERAARQIASADVFLGDCSALHVLAVAVGTPCVIVEPMEARWNDIFYPLGKTGRVRLVTGNDGLPTCDARHTADVLREVLGG